MYDVCIIGAGVVGCAIARRLSRYQLKIALVEAENDVSMGSSKANSAIVHGGYAEANAKLKGRVCYQGRRQYAQLDKELNFGFRETGSLVITMNEDDLPALEAIKENGEKNGLPDLEILEHDEILALEPNINPDVKYALYCKGAGVCSPYEMTVALAENAIHNGVELFLNSPVSDIDVQDDGSFVVHTPGADFASRFVVNAAGLHSDKVDQMVNEPTFTITPRSGEYILLGRGTGGVLNTVVFSMPTKMGKGILVTSTYHDNLLLGPDAIDEDAATATKRTKVDRLYNIYKQGLASYAHVDPSKFIRSFCGLRAVSSTDDFVIGPSATPGFFNVAGIQSPGLTSAPGIADLVTEMLEEAGLDLVPDETYDPYRAPIIERKTEMKPADYVHRHLDLPYDDPKKYICRCEQVTAGEVKDALTREIPVMTVDGVKRRTRAGMGFCQGGFCRNRVRKMIDLTYGTAIDPLSDQQESGYERVTRQEFLDYLKEQEGEGFDYAAYCKEAAVAMKEDAARAAAARAAWEKK
ncbi:MAG: NAD(P)/FAD-dependent oxidoreductase [Clostridia bacterium]|nr:NAD(P)/FAD-dependent oxidoreductase [Clostridia bacterium]